MSATICERMLRRMQHALGVDRRSLALLRVALAAVVLVDLADRSADGLAAHYTDAGVLNRLVGLELYANEFAITPHWLVGAVPLVAGLFALHAVIALLFALGWRTSLTHALLWLAQVHTILSE